MSGPDRRALAGLCILLAVASGATVARGRVPTVAPALAGPVDLGGGASLPRALARPGSLPVPGCAAPARVGFVAASPYGVAPGALVPASPGDRVSYAYRGWTLPGRLGPPGLAAAYFARRALAALTRAGAVPIDDLAVEVVVPSGCEATTDDVMAALRRAVAAHRAG